MPDIYSSGGSDGHMGSISPVSWASARDATTAGSNGRTSTRFASAISAVKSAGRGGTIYAAIRSFLFFDTSGISTAPESASLFIYGFNQESADFFVVKSTHTAEFSEADFDSIDGWSSGVDNESNVTKYSDEFDASADWDDSGYNTISLNSTALTDIANEDAFAVCLIQSVNDLRNVEPSSVLTTGMYFSDYTGTSRDPFLRYVEATTATDNSVFFGCNF
tara:strand:+ start:6555 stop:7214 length:660 start_codon:yes stop_codon:yes gene_type:complete